MYTILSSMVSRFLGLKSLAKMPFLADLGAQAAGQVVDSALGLVTAGFNDRRQLRQQEKLNKQQSKYDQALMAYQQGLGIKTWKETGYGAQKQMMKDADLSPALMYGGSGGGGMTVGNANATVGAPKAPTGGGEMEALSVVGAQRRLLEAQARNLDADTAKKTGVDTDLVKEQIRIQRNAADFAKNTYDVNYGMLLDAAEKLSNEAEIARGNRNVRNATIDTEIQTRKAELVGLGIANEVKKLQGELTEEQIKATAESVAQKWREIDIKQGKLDLDKFVNDVKESTKLTTETIMKVISILK